MRFTVDGDGRHPHMVAEDREDFLRGVVAFPQSLPLAGHDGWLPNSFLAASSSPESLC